MYEVYSHGILIPVFFKNGITKSRHSGDSSLSPQLPSSSLTIISSGSAGTQALMSLCTTTTSFHLSSATCGDSKASKMHSLAALAPAVAGAVSYRPIPQGYQCMLVLLNSIHFYLRRGRSNERQRPGDHRPPTRTQHGNNDASLLVNPAQNNMLHLRSFVVHYGVAL